MMKVIPGFPDDTVAVEVAGRISYKDYQDILNPAVDAKLKAHKNVKLLYAIGLIDAFDLTAIWEDASFGVRHWRDISHIALVCDYDWIKSLATLFAPLFPGEIRMFKMKELDTAREWLSAVPGSNHQKVA